MKKKDIEKELKKMEAMTQEEFEKAYIKDAVIPTARNEAEARYIAEHSAGITVFFKTKEMAEKFAELVKENVLCTIPTTNFDSEYGINHDGDKAVPKRMKDTPYFVRRYVNMREEEDNEQLHG